MRDGRDLARKRARDAQSRAVEILLVRVGADQSEGGGGWNGPIDSATGEFAYVPIPEGQPVHPGLEKPYASLQPVLERFGVALPEHLRERSMHLDPDFEHLTYGDQGQRARQLATLQPGDRLLFYAALADARAASLVYALIGMSVVGHLVLAAELSTDSRHMNAHSRRVLPPDAQDLVVVGLAGSSGRFQRCLPIGGHRDRAYRVTPELLDDWGGLSVKDGYLQRSARLPRALSPQRFLSWLDRQHPVLLRVNN